MVPEQMHVALLAGGTSGEREISRASGDGAQKALEEAGYQITRIDPAKLDELKLLFSDQFDVAFMCLHGKKGEDGAIQGLLEMLEIPYTCSGIQASAVAMDKAKSKVLYEHAGIATAPSVTFLKGQGYDIDAIVAQIGIPCVVKAATEGSSLGVEIIGKYEELANSIERVFEIDDLIVVEKYIAGDEFTVAVLGNEETTALPVIQIIPRGESYDFDSKYAPGGSEHVCPAPIDSELTEKLMKLAQLAHKTIGCSGVSRTDFIVDRDKKPWALETNTIPGMTATSLLPDAARAAGIAFPDLCTMLIEFALQRNYK